jgi:diguanylate cyclase (GGDEF)-like protein
MLARTRAGGQPLDATAEKRFERVGAVSTIVVARRMAGRGDDTEDEDAQESWLIFGELAAQRALPLNEVIALCLRWRDCAEETVRAIAAELELGPRARARAIAMLQRSLASTLAQMGEAFESERRRSDQERTRREEELAFLATHDPLTKLPNRALILDRLEQMLVRSRHSNTAVAALFIDLDDFKAINDTFGHEAGDELLKAVAARLAGVVRDVDALGRLSGDEFVLLAAEISPAEGPEVVAERLLAALVEPFEIGPGLAPLTITASIGIETGEQLSPGELLRDADVAMYRAKWAGKNRYFMFKHAAECSEAPQPRRGRGRGLLRRIGSRRATRTPLRRGSDSTSADAGQTPVS